MRAAGNNFVRGVMPVCYDDVLGAFRPCSIHLLSPELFALRKVCMRMRACALCALVFVLPSFIPPCFVVVSCARGPCSSLHGGFLARARHVALCV